MKPLLSCFLILLALLLCEPTNGLKAQIEGYAELGILNVADELATDKTSQYPGKTGFSLGADFLYGKRQLSPLLGLHVQSLNYENINGDLRLWQLMIPVGLAYHLRPRTTSFNIMATAAIAPYFGLDDPIENNRIVSERGLVLSPRAGITLTLDYLYLGYKLNAFPDGRFGGVNEWSWMSSFVIGGRF